MNDHLSRKRPLYISDHQSCKVLSQKNKSWNYSLWNLSKASTQNAKPRWPPTEGDRLQDLNPGSLFQVKKPRQSFNL